MSSKPTPGPWFQFKDDPLVIVDEKGASVGEMVPGDPYVPHGEARANAALVAEAGTVFHATGLTPQQLREQRDKLARCLKALADEAFKNMRGGKGHLIDEAYAAIASVEAAS